MKIVVRTQYILGFFILLPHFAENYSVLHHCFTFPHFCPPCRTSLVNAKTERLRRINLLTVINGLSSDRYGTQLNLTSETGCKILLVWNLYCMGVPTVVVF